MKIGQMLQPQSSFLSVEKDLNVIVGRILKNNRLKRLLYYTTKDCLDRPDLNEDQTLELIQNNIQLIPKIYIDKTVLNYLQINCDNFYPSSNPEFRGNIIEFDILCHNDQWNLKDFSLRPYKIAAEIDTMFNNKKLTGIGTLEFLSGGQIITNDEFSGLCLKYQAIHGGEDKYHLLNPADEERFLKDFYSQFEEE